jgi:cytochrome c553
MPIEKRTTLNSGKREHKVMSMMAKNLPDEDISLIESYFTSIAVTVKAP